MQRSSQPSRWFDKEPSLVAVMSRYAAEDESRAPYLLLGVIRTSAVGMVGGVLAFAPNEVFAHILKRALAAYACPDYGVGVLRTAKHPNGASFDLEQWRIRVRSLPSASRHGADVARLA